MSCSGTAKRHKVASSGIHGGEKPQTEKPKIAIDGGEARRRPWK